MGLQTGVVAVCQQFDFGLMQLMLPRKANVAVAEMQRRLRAPCPDHDGQSGAAWLGGQRHCGHCGHGVVGSALGLAAGLAQ